MSILIAKTWPRRAALRGLLGGGAVTVALPFLDCDLNSHGTALAATGQALPVRFGTWFWGLGHTPGFGALDKPATGTGITFGTEAAALTPLAGDLNYFGKFNVPLDGRSNYPHFTGWVASRCGQVPATGEEVPLPTLDLLVADVIGTRTRFKNLDLSATGDPTEHYSARNTHSRSAAEVSPINFYARMFGSEFVDPNKADFKPDPKIMVRQSALSAVNEERQKLLGRVGASDRAQLDEYFTSLRELEGQLALQLEKPAPNDACRAVAAPKDPGAMDQSVAGVEIDQVAASHAELTRILTMALACNQTQVFNMVWSHGGSRLRKAGATINHHSLSHEEQLDPKLGYQIQTSWFNTRSMVALAAFIDAFKAVREGSGTLLDNTLILAGSETCFAKVHSVDDIPFMTAGKAGGRIKTGLHVIGNGDPLTRVGLTAMRIMGVPIDRWGVKSLQTTKEISEILA